MANTAGAAQVGIVFEATTAGANILGATMRLDGYGFAAPESGGQTSVALTQGRRDVDNIGINLGLDNNPGAPDSLRGADDITGGPVNRFTFEYDMSLNVPGRIGTSEIRFDLVDGSGGGGGGGLPAGFNGLQYIASYGDLIGAFGANAAAGEQHYLAAGAAEGRATDTFDENQYLANYADLQAAFGADTQAATTHYITSGFAEGRVDEPVPVAVDGLQYIASNPDLIAAFGPNADAGVQHFNQFGQAEGRLADDFNENQYLANYTDLQAAFGGDTQAATIHYITSGFAEGRVDFLI